MAYSVGLSIGISARIVVMVASHALPPPTVEIYYSPTCAPCRLELPDVAHFARSDGARVRIVILGDEARARDDLRAVSPTLERNAVPAVDKNPRSALRSAGDADGILPYARAISSDGQVCAQWRGRIGVSTVRSMVSACKRMLIAPRPQRS